jgi:acylphosphatase
MTKICKKIKISGRVQGVWFRSATKKEAIKLNITGWVKNNHEGDVEVLACGDEQQISLFEKWLRRGPMLAKVTSVQSEIYNLETSHAGFEII